MKSLKSFLMLAVCLVTLGCSNNDDDVVVSSKEGKALGFSVTGSKQELRSSPLLVLIDFKAYARKYVSGSAAGTDALDFLGTSGSPGSLVYKEGAAWKYSPVKYIPTGDKVDVVAYSPANSQNVTSFATTWGASGPAFTYTVPAKLNGSEDLVVAKATDQDGVTPPQIALQFNHILSQITFAAKGDAATGFSWTITSVAIKNMYRAATYTYGTDAWTNYATKCDSTNVLAGPMIVNSTTPIDLTTVAQNTALYILPGAQDAPTETAIKGDVAPGDATKTFIIVSYKATETETGIDVTPQTSHIAYIPVTAGMFAKGTAYKATITLTKSIGAKIEFNPTVVAWASDTALDL
ncbi:MAG: fimbrillin family protein [Candidatus Symbiothrix sp.]|nr:fimbrillin family protein [Candidatus Symbiothrix sp.]